MKRIKKGLMLAASLLLLQIGSAKAFDIDTGNAAIEVIVPTIIPIALEDVSETAGDATLVLRATTLVTNAWFDATAPYHPTAVGVYSHLGRRPVAEQTNRNVNIALSHASFRVMMALAPNREQVWRDMMGTLGLDPDNNSVDTSTPEGLGNVAAQGVLVGRINDGMNTLGVADGRVFNPVPFADYTGYKPVNDAYRLRNPSRWQPDLQRKGLGLYKIQQFVTPQYALVEPYSYDNPADHFIPPPRKSNHRRWFAYKSQADEVLAASANLTEEQKLMAEFFDNKFDSLGISAAFAAQSQGLSTLEWVHLDFLVNMAAHDAGISIWHWKREYDAVRPFSAIGYIYGDEEVTAWGGPGQGTVILPASEWKAYLEEADHPEYPSASSCFCAAHAQAARLYLGSDTLGYPFEFKAGSSRIEPGFTPAADTTLVFPTWTDFEQQCGQSRVWAGVHFQSAVDESLQACGEFGNMAYDYVSSLIAGTAQLRDPAVGRPFEPKKRRHRKYH